MKKVFKIIGAVLLAIILIVFFIMKLLSLRPAAPKDYQSKTETGGEIEAKYMANGPYEVSSKERSRIKRFERFILPLLSHLPYPIFYHTEKESATASWVEKRAVTVVTACGKCHIRRR